MTLKLGLCDAVYQMAMAPVQLVDFTRGRFIKTDDATAPEREDKFEHLKKKKRHDFFSQGGKCPKASCVSPGLTKDADSAINLPLGVQLALTGMSTRLSKQTALGSSAEDRFSLDFPE